MGSPKIERLQGRGSSEIGSGKTLNAKCPKKTNHNNNPDHPSQDHAAERLVKIIEKSYLVVYKLLRRCNSKQA